MNSRERMLRAITQIDAIHQPPNGGLTLGIDGFTVHVKDGLASVRNGGTGFLPVIPRFCSLCFSEALAAGTADHTSGAGPCPHKAVAAKAVEFAEANDEQDAIMADFLDQPNLVQAPM